MAYGDELQNKQQDIRGLVSERLCANAPPASGMKYVGGGSFYSVDRGSAVFMTGPCGMPRAS